MLHKGEVIKISAWKRTSQYGELISLARNDYQPGQQYPKEVGIRVDENDLPF